MFWNEPTLYGATFPFREIPQMHVPMMGPVAPTWQNIPRFVPPVYGFNPSLYNVPPLHFNVPQIPFNPMLSQMTHPFLRQFDVPQMRQDLPFYNFYRPFF